MLWDQTLIQLFSKGGFAMWPLLVCSVVAVAIMLEKSAYFFRLRFKYEVFMSELKGLLAKRKTGDAVLFCRRSAHPVARLAEMYLKHLEHDDIRDEVLKREGSLALEKIEARLRALAALTHISPLLGLLGTVTGLVTAFHQIEILGGQVQPGDLAAGIWEALITTVFGLLIAIPCMAAYHGFESSADRIARRLQFLVLELDEFFKKKTTAQFRTQDIEKTEGEMKAVS